LELGLCPHVDEIELLPVELPEVMEETELVRFRPCPVALEGTFWTSERLTLPWVKVGKPIVMVVPPRPVDDPLLVFFRLRFLSSASAAVAVSEAAKLSAVKFMFPEFSTVGSMKSKSFLM